MAFERCLYAYDICQEMLLATDTTGEPIIKKFEADFEENRTPFENVRLRWSESIEGSMPSRKKLCLYNMVCIDCVVQRQHLVAKHLGGRLYEALGHAIKAVNIIIKNCTTRSPLPAFVRRE